MNEQLINEQYQYILRLIGQKRLKEALTQLESFLWKCPEWSLRTRLEQIQTSYSYMLQYMRQGVEDPERRKLYQKLLTDTLEITDQARITLLDSVSNQLSPVPYPPFRRGIPPHSGDADAYARIVQ